VLSQTDENEEKVIAYVRKTLSQPVSPAPPPIVKAEETRNGTNVVLTIVLLFNSGAALPCTSLSESPFFRSEFLVYVRT
jgi:hypothetical protein